MERSKSSVEELLESADGRREFAKEELAFEATEKIAELMELTRVSKSELAKRTGKSKAYITQVLSGSRNMTVHTLASLAFALGYKITLNATAVGHEVIYQECAMEPLLQPKPPSLEREIVLERGEHPAPAISSSKYLFSKIPQTTLQPAL
jgi:transcriptional regulator with XRE-family HTH domain